MTKKKKIVFTVINDLSTDRRMHRICSTLMSNNFEVTLVGRELKSSKDLNFYDFSYKRIKCFFNSGKLFYIEYNIRLLFYLMIKSFDIFGPVDMDTIIPSFLISKLKNKQLVFDSHEYFSEVPEVISRPMTQKIWKFLERKLLPKIKHGYTVSKSISRDYKNKFNANFKVIRNVPPISHLNINTPIENFDSYILYQGAVNIGRGLDEILNFISKTRLRILIAGEGDILQQLQKKYKNFNNIEFLGKVAPFKLDELTKNASIGLNLLENKGKSYYFSLANKFFDYMKYGVPSINMNFPEYKLINDEFNCTILIDDLTQESISYAFNQLKDESVYNQLSINSLKASKYFNWEKESKKLLDIYNNLD